MKPASVLKWAFVCVLASSSAACFPEPIVVRAQDAGGDVVDVQDPTTYTFTLRQFEFQDSTPFGLNLDGLTSTTSDADGCMKADAMGQMIESFPPDIGVDNAFPLFATELQTNVMFSSILLGMTNQVRTQKIQLIVRLSNVESLMNDTSVQVEVFTALPTFGQPCDDSVEGRTFAQWDRGTSRPSRVAGTGTIGQGVLSFTFPRTEILWLPFTFAGAKKLDLPMRGLSARMPIRALGISRPGYWGARLNASELYAAITTDNPTLSATALEAALASTVDLRVVQDANPCGFTQPGSLAGSHDLSFGFHADLVAASLSQTPLAMPAPNTCGTLP